MGRVCLAVSDNHRYYQAVVTYTTSEDPLGGKLLAAAAEVFAEFGYDRAKVAEIARRAGVTTGAIYSRYRGKADLLADALGTHLVEQIERVLPEAPEGGVALLSIMGAHLLDAPQSANWLVMEAVVAARRDPELAAMIRRSFEDDESRISKHIQQAKDDGQIDRSLSTLAVAQFAMAVGMGMNISRLLNREQPSTDDWNEVIDRVLFAATPEFSRSSTDKEAH
ncbi:MAG: TetR/AcrR family transcriptional repressor of uid operon [Verrucomicrobiales bacterium]|jgi:TetR/AcrR family transcriptional repressor of uid operon